MVAYNCRTNLLHWQTATIMWYWSLKPFNSSSSVDLINWRSWVCLERVSVVNFRNICLNTAYIYQNSIWLIHLSSYYTRDSYVISGVNHILIINIEFNYIHDVLSPTANATGFSHTTAWKDLSDTSSQSSYPQFFSPGCPATEQLVIELIEGCNMETAEKDNRCSRGRYDED